MGSTSFEISRTTPAQRMLTSREPGTQVINITIALCYSPAKLALSKKSFCVRWWRLDPLTTEEVAQMLGVSQSRVRQFVLAKRLKARKLGRDLVIERKEAERFGREGRLPKGRPAGSRKKS
jgi:excisionase family DNA binding protein